MTEEELLKLKTEYDKLDKKVQTLSAKRASVWRTMTDNCTHPSTTKKSQYFSGSYYDRSYTEYYDECIICKAQLNVKTVSGSYG